MMPDETYQLLVDEAPDALVALSPAGRVLAWNRGAAEMFGYAADEALGQTLAALILPVGEKGVGADAAPAGVDEHAYEAIRRRKDGTLLCVDATRRAVRNASGAVTHLVLCKKDVTHLKTLRDARLVEARYRGLLESVPDAIVMINTLGRIVLVNGQVEGVFGYGRKELIGATVEVLLPERLRATHIGHRLAYFAAPRARPMGAELDLRGRRKSGEEFPVEISLSPMMTDEGVFVMSAIRDVTTLKRAEEMSRLAAELARSNAELERFAYIASHDLQEPLRAISGFAQLLSEQYRGQLDEEADEYIDFIVDGATRMQALIQGVLLVSRVGASDRPFAAVDCNVVVEDVLALLDSSIADTKATVTQGDLPVVHGDAVQLAQVFQNLLSNGMKFAAPGAAPRIHVDAERIDGWWRIRVRDEGIGIETRHFERIFAMFQRLHTREEYPGTGIGLALCKKIVERHGGRIGVDSEEGAGSTFWFTLPEAKENERHGNDPEAD